MSPINVNLLSYHKDSNSLSVDLSELEAAGHMIGQVIAVKSFKTGNVVEFTFIQANRDRDDDITEWVYLPVHEGTHVVNPNAPVNRLTIWND